MTRPGGGRGVSILISFSFYQLFSCQSVLLAEPRELENKRMPMSWSVKISLQGYRAGQRRGADGCVREWGTHKHCKIMVKVSIISNNIISSVFENF